MSELVELLSNIATELESVEVRCTERPSTSFKDAVGDAVARINSGPIPRNLMLAERWTVCDEHVKMVYDLAHIRPLQALARIALRSAPYTGCTATYRPKWSKV